MGNPPGRWTLTFQIHVPQNPLALSTLWPFFSRKSNFQHRA
jgi:hypothetical protein